MVYIFRNLIFLLLLTGLVFSTTSCNKEKLPEDVPTCIEDKIKEYKNVSPNASCDKAYIKEYTFQGRTVYKGYAGDACVDGGQTIFDENCEQICFLGGLAGIRDCDGEVFNETATFVKLIWEEDE